MGSAAALLIAALDALVYGVWVLPTLVDALR